MAPARHARRVSAVRGRARAAQVGTLNYMSPEAILGGATNIRGGPPMKVGPWGDRVRVRVIVSAAGLG
jgi:hypothetical protein